MAYLRQCLQEVRAKRGEWLPPQPQAGDSAPAAAPQPGAVERREHADFEVPEGDRPPRSAP